MKALLSLLLSCSVLCCFGQTNKVLSGDTTYWYSYYDNLSNQIEVKNLFPCKDSLHFRLWAGQSVMDVWTEDGITCKGNITHFIGTINYPLTSYYCQNVMVPREIASKAMTLMQRVAALPSDNKIAGYKQGFDGMTYILESSTPSAYNFRTYWTPQVQDSSIAEVRAIQLFIDDYEELMDSVSNFSDFRKGLPAGITFKPISGMTFTKIDFSKPKKLTRRDLNNAYLRKISDTLNTYLEERLSPILLKDSTLDCSYDFDLIFSKKNKLLRVRATSKYYKEEKKHCIKSIKAAFKDIRIDFVHSKWRYKKSIYIDYEVMID